MRESEYCPICRNKVEIAKFIGVGKDMIPHLIDKHQLPVFQIDGKGNLKALKKSLTKWLEDMEDKFLAT